MKYLLLFFLILIFSFSAYCQDSLKRSNPVIYGESVYGISFGKTGGLTGGGQLNYQFKKNLISIKYTGRLKLKSQLEMITPVTAFPIIEERNSSNEFSALYGLRFLETGQAFNFSLGISETILREVFKDEEQTKYSKIQHYLGVPYELSMNFFKSKRDRFKLYNFFPIGPKTAFGGGVGVKIFGNISKFTTHGLAVSYSLGYHKKY
ncbi:MAG: hypothetical protein ABI390_07780 [Daejeonella sp.]